MCKRDVPLCAECARHLCKSLHLHSSFMRGVCVCCTLRMQGTVEDDPMAQDKERMTVVCIRDLSHSHMLI
jgi:hypothetical protein